MNNRLNRTSILTMTFGAAAILVPVILYFSLIYPLNAEINLTEQQLQSEEQLIDALLSNKHSETSVSLESSAELQKQIPVKPLVDQLILEVEKAELVSGSLVASVAITEAEITSLTEVEESPEQMENPLESGADGNAANETSAEKVEVVTEPVPADIQAPTGLYKVLMNLSVTSDSYFELQQFLSVLEDSKRIMEIEQISFTDDSEKISVNDISEPLVYTLGVAAYYYPELEELIGELPLIVAPPPADKSNPLPQFPDLESGDDE